MGQPDYDGSTHRKLAYRTCWPSFTIALAAHSPRLETELAEVTGSTFSEDQEPGSYTPDSLRTKVLERDMDMDLLENCLLTAVLDNMPDFSDTFTTQLDASFLPELNTLRQPLTPTSLTCGFTDANVDMLRQYGLHSAPGAINHMHPITTLQAPVPSAGSGPMLGDYGHRQVQSLSVEAYLSERNNSVGAGRTPKQTPSLPPCRVCGGEASGFHYGVNTCKACKGFFHRCLHRKSDFECGKNGNCNISQDGKSSCPACRYRRCLAVGMTKEAAKIGRYTHWKRTQDTIEIKRLRSSLSPEAGLDMVKLADSIGEAFEKSFGEIAIFYTDPDRIQAMKKELLALYKADSVDFVMVGDPEGRSLMSRNVTGTPSVSSLERQAEGATAKYSPEREHLVLKAWAERTDVFIRAIVTFAKCIPGFKDLPMTDQIALVKEARAEIQCLLYYRRIEKNLMCVLNYNAAKNALVLVPGKLIRLLCHDDDFLELATMNLSRLDGCGLQDVALLTAIVLASPDREHLTASKQVEAMQEKLVEALACRIRGGHPTPHIASTKVFANALLVLPALRTWGSRHHQHVERWQKSYPLELSPLVQECLISPEASMKIAVNKTNT